MDSAIAAAATAAHQSARLSEKWEGAGFMKALT
jgi:hypothetical protein